MNTKKYKIAFFLLFSHLFASNALAAEDLLSVNKTVIIQIIIFIAAIFILNALVFKPFLSLIDRRHKLTRGAIEEAEELERKVKGIIEEYDQKLAEARAQAQEERSKIVQEAESASSAMISKAREEAEGILEEAKGKLETEASVMKEKLKGEVQLLAKDIASKVLGKEVQA